MTSIRDIAKLAGASVATVSRVINHSGYVSAATRARVEQAIAALDFTPSANARRMRSGSSKMVGVVLPALDVPFFGILAHVVEQELFQRGLQALICCTDESAAQEARYISMLLAHKVDGVLAASVLEDSTQYQRLVDAGVPIVAIDRALPGLAAHSVTADHFTGGRMMAEHLLSLGHRRIAVIGAPSHSTPVQARVQGAVERLAEAGLSAQVVLGGAHDFDSCRSLAERILAQGTAEDRPTALIGTTDIAAIGAIHAAIGMELSVPDDISVIGFDDLPEARYVLPALTTVAQPLREIGVQAVAQLSALMAGELVEPAELPLRLMLRDTTAPPR
ncbi:LacI family DNA-binding transcriptional regulator [Cypionkella sp.]|uniref:LacI family DNA-binding transcriptional regulator n=1 Tax=Cypionkella sp. TaxID=2811411 RepID=UPI002ABCE6E5|nr:LacI family DNA-binding transcriptional regulator [Cypionkella sp.]MDZ4395700.1 LacI family DNA-binding transcriptional regulator [Cypionkella sp.]